MTSRRDLLTGVLAAAATWTMADARTAASRPRYRRIGYTGITWGYSADDAPNAIRDVGELGYRGFESCGGVLEAWESRGGLQAQLEAQQLPLVGACCPMNLTDPAQRADIITTLNDIGLALTDIGITAALHPHSGSCIMTREEIWSVLESTNSRDVRLCPDTGELLASGVDPLETIQHFGELIAHVHVKDYDGGRSHDGFAPVGHGKLKVGAIMDALEELPGQFMVMVELNPDPAENKADPSAPRRAAAQSKATFAALGYRFRS